MVFARNSRDGEKGLGLGFGVGTEMEEITKLEEGEAYDDIALSYLGEKLQDVLGRFQNIFEDEDSSEDLESRIDGYGSFLPTYQRLPSSSYTRTPPATHNNNRSISPYNILPEGGRRPSLASASTYQSGRPVASSAVLPQLKAPMANGKINSAPPPAQDEDSSLKSGIVMKPTNGRVGIVNLSTQKKAEIYSGLGLDVSPSSSLDDSPMDGEGFPHDLKDSRYESPTSILQIMTSYPMHDGLLLSPLSDDLMCLTEKDAVVERSDIKVFSSVRTVETKCHDVQSSKNVKEVPTADSSVESKSKKTSYRETVLSKSGSEDMKKTHARDRYRDFFGDIEAEEDDNDETRLQEIHSPEMLNNSHAVSDKCSVERDSMMKERVNGKNTEKSSGTTHTLDESCHKTSGLQSSSVVEKKHKNEEKKDFLDNHSDGGMKNATVMRNTSEMDLDVSSEKINQDKNMVSARKTEVDSDLSSMPVSKCDSRDSSTKRKARELRNSETCNPQDSAEEIRDDARRKEKKARVSKTADSSKRDLCNSQPSVAATSISYKVSSSRKNNTSIQELKGSPVKSVLSSPPRITDTDTRTNLERKDGSKNASPFPTSSPKRSSDGEKGSSSWHKEKKSRTSGSYSDQCKGKDPDILNLSSDQMLLDEEKMTARKNKSQERTGVGLDRLKKNSKKESSEKLLDQSRRDQNETVVFKEPVPGSERGNGANLLTVDALEREKSNASRQGKKAKNQPHKVRNLDVPSPVRKESSSQAATNAIKEATNLKHLADRLKNSGSSDESTGIYFQSALKFLQGASLLELDNTKRGEMNQSRRIYSSTAKLCQFCAHEYEKLKDMASAALAYKCMEVAHLRVVHASQSEATRYRNELQTALQICPPGESPFSSVSDADNLNNPATADKAALAKVVGSPQVAGNHVVSARSSSSFMRLINLAQEVNFAMEASRKSRVAFAAANGLVDTQCKESTLSVKKALDFNFHDVDGLLRLVRVAMEAISH